MTKKEFAIIAKAIKTFYPREGLLPTPEAIELWYQELSDLEYQEATAALRKHVETSPFPPTIADIRSKVIDARRGRGLSGMEAWALVYGCLHGGQGIRERFESFPPAVKGAVGSYRQLRQWSITEGLNLDVVRSQFIKAYNTELAREREEGLITPETLKMLQSISERLACKERPTLENHSGNLLEAAP